MQPYFISLFAILLVIRLWGVTEPPNIIFLLGDDQSWYDYSFMREAGVEDEAILNMPRNISGIAPIYPVADTPALDRLAENGLTFLHGVTTPLCRPSLAAVVTGTDPHHNRITGNDLKGGAADEVVEAQMQVMQTLPRLLGELRGYQSFQTGKWWEGDYANGGFTFGDTRNSQNLSERPSQWAGSRPSYATARHGDWGLMIGRVDYLNNIENPEHWDDVNGQRINYANTVVPVTDWIDTQDAAGKPFFIWYAPFLPHTPHDPPPKLLNKWDDLIEEPDEAGNYQAKYYANIERLDGGIEAILDHLDAKGLTDNTLIIYYHDNGWINQDTQSYFDGRSKRSPYEGGVRTPIIVHWPEKIKSGGEIEPQFVRNPVSATDIANTVLAAAGIEPSPEMLGLNLMDLDAVQMRETIYCEENDHDMQNFPNSVASLNRTFIYRDGWKMLKTPNGYVELYQLYDSNEAPIDPHEMDNRAGTESVKVAELTAALDDWYGTPKDMEWSADQAQTHASTTQLLHTEIGQVFTPSTDQKLIGVRVGIKPLNSPQDITLELRELDIEGAPLGAILASATLPVEELVINELRWYRFAFSHAVDLSDGLPVGFCLRSSAGAGGLEVAHVPVDVYACGDMYYPGTIEGQLWTEAGYDLCFETLTAQYTQPAKMDLISAGDGASATLTGNLPIKNVEAVLQQSATLDTWLDHASDANLDGRVNWVVPLDEDRAFFRIRYGSAGDLITLGEDPAPPTSYTEAFNGSGANINGRLIGDSAWIAPSSSVILDDGSFIGGQSTAYIPFVPVEGYKYTLSIQMQQGAVSDDDGWIAFGFMEKPPTTGNIVGNGVIWALTRNLSSNENQVLHVNATGGTGSVNRGNYVTTAGEVTMSIVLDTTCGSSHWSYDWIVDGVTRVSNAPLDMAFKSAIGGIGIGIGAVTPSANLEFGAFELSVD